MDDLKKIIYSVLSIFVIGILVWVGIVFVNSCGFDLTCAKASKPIGLTPIPTLIPATLPAASRFLPTPAVEEVVEPAASADGVARPSNPGGPGEAVDLTGDSAEGAKIFAANCIPCHGAEGVGGVPNFGSKDGIVPALNPVNPTLKDADYKIFATNLALFLQHGSTPAGTSPIFQMPAWGDLGTLTQQQIADVIAYVISLNK
jgi:mono/diheme cytochrome c family protein